MLISKPKNGLILFTQMSYYPKVLYFVIMISLCLQISKVSAADTEKPFPDLNPIHGPTTVDLGSYGTILLPDGYTFIDGSDVRKFNEYVNEPSNGNEIGTIMANENDGEYEIHFSFWEEGYIKDDEKKDLNSDEVLESLIEGNEQTNVKRREMGGGTLTVLGWEYEPDYNDITKNLEWAVRLRDDEQNHILLNHNTRILGRKGYVSAVLVCDPDKYQKVLGIYQRVMDKFKFSPGDGYADYKQGDRIAKYGLTALMTGGVAAVAAKSGLFKYLWKIVVGIGVAVVAVISKVFLKKN